MAFVTAPTGNPTVAVRRTTTLKLPLIAATAAAVARPSVGQAFPRGKT